MLQSTLRGLIAVLLLFPMLLSAQEEGEPIQIFGSLQTLFMQEFFNVSSERYREDFRYGGEFDVTRNTFIMQQMDIFLAKPLDNKFNAFIDLEFQLNYNAERKWGTFSVQEAWLNYSHDSYVNIKAGMLYPAFNRLNEIKNRLAILPYLFRPVVYERLLSSQFATDDFVPERAFLQFYGAAPFNDYFLDYAAYMGNAEAAYLSYNGPDGRPVSVIHEGHEWLSGVDPTTTEYKLFGTRIGLRSSDEQFIAGVSLTHDYNRFVDSLNNAGVPTGDARRMRLGGDISYSLGGFTFDAEYIKVFYDYEKADAAGIQLNQQFAYTMLGYNFTDDLYLYGQFSWGNQAIDPPIESSNYFTYTVGSAYKLTNAITAKGQLYYFRSRENWEDRDGPIGKAKVDIYFVFLGCSVMF